ncbi:MAG: peptide deformylase [Janthinobacterium lividum]
MAILKIARMGHPVLLQRCLPVADPRDPEIRRLVADMIETMEDAGGIGLAAPQVHVALRLFVFRVPQARLAKGADRGDGADGTEGGAAEGGAGQAEAVGPVVLINPVVEALDEATVAGWEGCLSIPGMRAAVPRHPRVRYSGVDCDGRVVSAEAGGLHAVVVQHENDHLDGVLYPMRVTDFALFGFGDEMLRFAPALPGEGA